MYWRECSSADMVLCLQDRMQLWHDQTHRYHTELQDFKKLTAEAMDGLAKDHSLLSEDLKGAAARMDRVEHEMDYVQTQTSPRACVRKADKVLEQGEWSLRESIGPEEDDREDHWEEVHSRVSGEFAGNTHPLESCRGFDLVTPSSLLAQSASRISRIAHIGVACPGIEAIQLPYVELLSWKKNKTSSWKMGNKHGVVTNHLMCALSY